MTRNRWALVAVALATFMTYLDNNIINVAIPAIAQDLQLTTSGLEWVVSSYILVFASLLLAGGRLARERPGLGSSCAAVGCEPARLMA